MSPCTGIVHQFHMMMFVTFAFAVHTFKFELYQSNSYNSLFNDSNLSKKDVIRKIITHNINRSIVTPNTKTNSISPFYYIKIRIGSPPVEALVAIDTGSDNTWIQCQPCIHCLPQTTPIFDPLKSSSYAKISCGPEKTCPSEEMSECRDGFCHYNFQYYDGSYSKGMLSTDKMRIESTIHNNVIEIPEFLFGCGNDIFHPYVDEFTAILGLADGPHSLISQLGMHAMQRFSYCFSTLIMDPKIGHIHFGSDAKVRGIGTVVVPFFKKHPRVFYYLTIEAFTVGTVRIEFKSLMGNVEEGNTFIDSGTSAIRLPYRYYLRLKQAVKMQASAPPDHEHMGMLCFKRHNSLKLPKIVVHFRGGDVTLRRYNAYVTYESSECLMFTGHQTDYGIYGYFAQKNFIVSYDLLGRTVSFKPFGCTKF